MRLLAVAIAVLALLPAVAQAAPFEVGAADDYSIVTNTNGERDATLAQMRNAGVTRVRFILWSTTDRGQLDGAVQAVRDAGLNVHLTLAYTATNPQDAARWASAAAAHYAPWVTSFGIGNEPDLALSRDRSCDLEAKGIKVSVKRVNVQKRYRGKVKRVRAHSAGVVVFRGAIKGHTVHLIRKRAVRGRGSSRRYVVLFYRTVRERRKVVTAGTSRPILAERVCGRIAAGELYRRQVQAIAPAIRAAAPGARVLAGETSPIEPVGYFMQAAANGGLPVDGWAQHPYQSGNPEQSHQGGAGIGDLDRVHALTDLPIYVTEFGYHRLGDGYADQDASDEYIAQLIPRVFAIAARSHVRMLAWHGWNVPPAGWGGSWDTGLGVVDGQSVPLQAFSAAAMG
jgi:hypothetical protein